MGLCDMCYEFYYVDYADSFKIAGFNLEKTPPNRSQLLPALYKQLIDGMKQN